MKSFRTLTILLLSITTLYGNLSQAQQHDNLINLLLKKNLITPKEADSLKKEATTNGQKDKQGITIGNNALQLGGLLQTEYQGFEQTNIPNTFLLHRARLILKGVISDNWSYELSTEFTNSPKIFDAYISYKFADYLKLTAGQFKTPFSQENITSDSQLEFIDRSQVVNALAGRQTDVIGNQQGRDAGIQASGSFIKTDNHYLLDYTLGVFNGNGINVASDNNAHKDIAGRLGIHPINELTIGLNFYSGQGNYGTPAQNYTRNRTGFDARYIVGNLSLTAEYDKGTDGAIKKDGWYAQTAYFVIPKKLQLAAKYDNYNANKDIANSSTRIYTGGANYFFNNWAKFSINYLDRREATIQLPNNIFEAQLQLVF